MSEIDIYSPTWRAIDKWATDRLSKSRARLELSGIDPSETEHLRGKIEELKALVALGGNKGSSQTTRSE